MDVQDFRRRLLNMAGIPDFSTVEIEKFIHNFFMYKPLPIANYVFDSVTRASVNGKDEIFKNTSRCSYNPYLETIPMMRCNYERQQVFYAAIPTELGASTTAILETTMENIRDQDIKRHYLTLSRWHVAQPLPLFVFPFSQTSIQRNKDFAMANGIVNAMFAQTFSPKDAEAVQYFKDSLEFMSDVFCETENKLLYYRISSAFVNCIMTFAKKKNIAIAGVMYPSANTLSSGISMVLKKELIDQKALVCDYVQMYAVQRDLDDPKRIAFEIASSGTIPDADGNLNILNIR